MVKGSTNRPFGRLVLPFVEACTGEKETGVKNVEITLDGDILTIRVDLSKEFGPSSSGKTIIVATTEGNVSIPSRDEKIGLNVYRKK